MKDSAPYHQYHQDSSKGSSNDNADYRKFMEEVRFKRRKRRKKQKEKRKRSRDESQKKSCVQDKCGGNKKVNSTRHGKDMGRSFQNVNYNAKNKDDYICTTEADARQSDENYPKNNGNCQEYRERPSVIDMKETASFVDEKSSARQSERPNNQIPRKTYFIDLNESIDGDSGDDIMLNIKIEKTDDETRIDKHSNSSSNDSEESSIDSAVLRLQGVVNSVLLKTPSKNSPQAKINIRKEKRSSPSGTSSHSSSDSDNNTHNSPPAKTASAKKSSAEEEVICLGKLERKEDLVDDEGEDMPLPMEDQKVCFLCEKTGHVAFECFMVCKNCNDQYHGLKNCPQPPNISVVLHFFMQFCMDQVFMYDPSSKSNSECYQQINPQPFPNHERSMESMWDNFIKRKRRNVNDAGSVSKARHRHREDSSTKESGSDSDENVKRKFKRRSKLVSDFDVPQQIPFASAVYGAALPFAFNPEMNPFLVLEQMMQYKNGSLRWSDKNNTN